MPAPFYETEIAQLEAALAAPEREIQSGGFGGDRVQYSSKSEILASLAYFRNLAKAARDNGKPSTTLAVYKPD